jgi:3-oxoacyl-[acyl-carrier protein] reductase
VGSDPGAGLRLSGKVCAVTGASRGIGRAIAEELHAHGAKLSLCALRSVPEAPAGADALSARCDVADANEVARWFGETERRFGGVDVLVLNAGVLERGAVAELSEAQWDRVLDTNLKGAFLCARAAWPALARRKGRIVAVGSISGTLGTAQAAAYNASKWGLTGLVKSLAEEGRAQGVFCATVLPSAVETDMVRQTPFSPQMQPQDVARVVRFLCAEAPFAMTGSAVEVFG